MYLATSDYAHAVHADRLRDAATRRAVRAARRYASEHDGLGSPVARWQVVLAWFRTDRIGEPCPTC